MSNGDRFESAAARVLHDPALRSAYRHVTTRFIDHRTASLATIDADALIAQASDARGRAVDAMPRLVDEFAARIANNGAIVHRAATHADAREIITAICRGVNAHRVAKSKSMTSEEVGLNDALEAAGIEVVETDLGERIIQLAHEPPAHIVAPSIEFDRHRVTGLFQRHLGQPPSREIAELTRQARVTLREAFRTADVGITGANFLVAETGSLAIVTNEGNARMCATIPPVQIALVGSEKVLETLDDLGTLQRALMRGSTGQPFTSYFQLISGPRRSGELDGPDELHVVLLDDYRGAIRNDDTFRDALRCIRCSSCINVCPVYNRAGARAYGWVYPGPIGTVLTSLRHPGRMADLAEACSLCGHCTAICPVGIDLEQMHLDLRDRVRQTSGSERVGWSMAFGMFRRITQHPRLWSFLFRVGAWAGRLTGGLRSGWVKRSPLAWTKRRDARLPARESFQRWWARSRARKYATTGGNSTISPAPESSVMAAGHTNTTTTTTTTNDAIAAPRSDDLVSMFIAAAERAGAVVVSDLVEWLAAVEPGPLWIDDDLGPFDAVVRDAVRQADRQLITTRDLHASNRRAWRDRVFRDVPVGVARAAYALADTGTVLDVTAPHRARSMSLVPPRSLVLVDPATIRPDVATALRDLPRPLPTAVTFITGPSRTADIEQTLTVGVHGPLELALYLLPANSP